MIELFEQLYLVQNDMCIFRCVCRSTIEETYARSMTKLAKTAGNFSQLG